MKICCFPFLCFGEGEEDNNIETSRDTYYIYRCIRGKEHMKEGILGNDSEEMENDDCKLGFWETCDSVGGEGKELGLQVNDERANRRENNKRFESFDFDGEKSQDLLRRINDVESRCATTGGGGNQGLKVDVNLNLGLGGEPSSSTSTEIGMGRENCIGDTQNKRPKVHSFSL